MTRVKKDGTRLELCFGADQEQVESAVDEIRHYLFAQAVAEDSRLILALRELLNNAVEHGSGSDPDREVRLSVAAISPRRYRIAVADQGRGFDHESLDLTLPDDPEQLRKRGLPLVNSFADELRFAGSGSEVVMYFTISGETVLDVAVEDGRVRITPGGDLTANTARKLRERLRELHDAGHRRFLFDFESVADMDSVALSVFVILAGMLPRAEGGADLAIRNAGRDIVNMFQLTRLDRSYRIESLRGPDRV